MAINLEDHKIYVESLGMDMVPYVIVKQIITEQSELSEENMKIISKGLKRSEDTLSMLINEIGKAT